MTPALSAPGALRTGFILTLTGCALVVGACGSSGSDGSSDASSSDSDRETAQLKLQECLRKNGVELPRPPAGGQGSSNMKRPSAAERQKMRKAMEGPCKKYQQEAFGNITEEDRQEMRDRMVKFSSCMRKHGIDIPEPKAGGGPQSFSMRQSPKLDKATEACRKLLPEGGGPGGGRGGGGGPRIQMGPAPSGGS